MNPAFDRILRTALLVLATALLAVGFGFWVRAPWALALWPWPDGPLSYLFVASIVLAEGATMLWTGLTLELEAARGGALGFAAMNLGLAVTAGGLHHERGGALLLGWALTCGLLAFGGLFLYVLGPRYPRRDTRPVPAFVRLSFLLFSLALSVATAMLLARAPIVFPWPLKPESSTMFGFLFLASALYFFDGWRRPGAANAFGQLIGFLVYDLVLLPPYLAHWSKARGGFRVSLAIYLVVLVWSAALAIGFLWRYGRRGKI